MWSWISSRMFFTSSEFSTNVSMGEESSFEALEFITTLTNNKSSISMQIRVRASPTRGAYLS
jgi:hypothetical protein